jgi:hypothetical protein
VSVQLDLFIHGDRPRLLASLAAALVQPGQLAAVQGMARVLGEANPDDPLLPALQQLLAAQAAPPQSGWDAGQLTAWISLLQHDLPLAAARLLPPHRARQWLQYRWEELAVTLLPWPWTPAQAELHPAPCWLQAGQWAAAINAVQRIPNWRRQATPLSWMAEAQWQLHGTPEAWPALAELAWRAPEALPPLLARLADPELSRLLQRFQRDFTLENRGADADSGENPLVWFPAWCLAQDADLAPALRPTPTGPLHDGEKALRLLLELRAAEAQGRHDALLNLSRKLHYLAPELQGQLRFGE